MTAVFLLVTAFGLHATDGGVDFPMPQFVRPPKPGPLQPGTSPNPVMWERKDAQRLARLLDSRMQLAGGTTATAALFAKLSTEEKRLLLDAALKSMDEPTAVQALALSVDLRAQEDWKKTKSLRTLPDQASEKLFGQVVGLEATSRMAATQAGFLALSQERRLDIGGLLEGDGGTF